MILYIILAEITIQNIQENKKIKGIQVLEKKIKISVFADDTTLYIGDNRSFPYLQNQLQDFGQFLGVKYNRNKCFGMWLGVNIDNTEKPMGFKWNSDQIKILVYSEFPRQYDNKLAQSENKNAK